MSVKHIPNKENKMINPSEDYMSQSGWVEEASLTDICDDISAAILTGADLAAASLEARGVELALCKVPMGAVAVQFRVWADGAAANENAVLELYAAAGSDYYQHVATLTCTVGTAQKGAADKLFVDTMAETVAFNWFSDDASVQIGGLNQVASFILNTHGYDRFAFLAKSATMDLDPPGDTLHIDIRRC